MKMMRPIFAFALLLSVAGCAGLKSSEAPPTIYSLRPAAASDEAVTGASRILEIAAPSVPPGMDRDRIALYLNQGQKLDYFAASAWSSDLGDVIQNFTRRTATSVLPYIVAVTPDQSIDADYRLQMKVNEFQPVYGSNLKEIPKLVVNVEFTLVALPLEKIVNSFTLSKEIESHGNRLDSITAGLEFLLQSIERDAFLKIDEKIKDKASQ